MPTRGTSQAVESWDCLRRLISCAAGVPVIHNREMILARRNDPRVPVDPTIPGAPDPQTNRGPDPITLPGGRPRTERRADDSIGAMLDMAYLTGDSYLKALADQSGGRLLRADTLGSLPDAFARIAAELRTQYSIGYYPSNTTHDGLYRKVKVSTTRKDVAVRAKPGYRAPEGG